MALLKQGCRVEMIDAGLDLEEDAVQNLVDLQAASPSEWVGERTSFLKAKMDAGVDGIPLKLAYGSDYPYRTPPWMQHITPIECRDADSKPSFAKGGLSNVWGSAVMPYRQEDMDDWPERTRDLSAYYKAVTEFMPVAACHDSLEREFSSYCDHESPMPSSAQATALTADWTKASATLAGAGITFGRSRLAVNAQGKGKPGGCVRCSLCMYGCPYRLIWSSADTVDQLRAHPDFTYRPGFTVTRVSEDDDTVHLEVDGQGGERQVIIAARVYLAAGVLSTTSILLRSLNRYDEPVAMKDSQYFLLPMLRKRGVPNFSRTDLHTLAQMFMEIVDQKTSPYTVHLQTYTYNELFEQPVNKMLGPLRSLFPSKAFFSRLFLFQGYLHSRHSPPVSITLEKTATGDKLRVVGATSPETSVILKRVVRKLLGLHSALGALPLAPLLRPGVPGRGFHSGGVFPMSDQPSPGESDIHGRPAGLKRIHAVDSTVMPSIAATTVTFTAMANAYRIGSLASSLES
jgi:choline dehydrogenase-like flavoprotein